MVLFLIDQQIFLHRPLDLSLLQFENLDWYSKNLFAFSKREEMEEITKIRKESEYKSVRVMKSEINRIDSYFRERGKEKKKQLVGSTTY